MTLLANVALTDTFDIWRQRTNQMIIEINRLDSENDSNTTNIGGALTTANSNITAAFLKANQVGEAVTTANGNITGVTSNVANLDGAITTANSNITAAFLKANQVGAAVTTANTNITNLGGALVTANGNITDLGGAIVTANSNIAAAFLKANQVGEAVTTANGNITASFNKANSAFANATGTFNGSLTTVGTISDNIGGVRIVPINSQTSAYVLVKSDVGKFISITTGGVTVPNAVFSVGENISIYNNSGSSQTITSASDITMYRVGTSTTGNRTLAQRGFATLLCVAANTFVISGGGLT